MKVGLFLILCYSFGFANDQSHDKSPIHKKPPIRFSVLESWAEPYAIFDSKSMLTSGIIKEFIEELSLRLKSDFELIYLSRMRAEAASNRGLLDIRCIIHESWVQKKEDYHWSPPLFNFVNGVVWKKRTSPINKLSDLENKTVGTVTGFQYPGLNDLFISGKLKRSDATSETINIGLLKKDRLEYIYTELSTFNWLIKHNKIPSMVEHDSFTVEQIPGKCGLLKTSRIKTQDFDSALESIVKDGVVKKLEAKYGLK